MCAVKCVHLLTVVPILLLYIVMYTGSKLITFSVCAQTFHRLCFFLYLLKMVFLTFALAIAARPELTDDQLNKYPQPLDYFRGICEVLLLIFIEINIIVEILEFTQWVDCIAWDMYRQVIV